MAEKDDGYVRFRCRACGQRLKVRKTSEGGTVIACPHCGASVNVPIVNLEAIAAATDMPETGQPGRLNLNPELLRKRLRGEDEERSGPGSVGGPPTLREGKWSAESAFGRIQELDQLAAALSKVEEDAMGQVQRIYRNRDLSAAQRDEQVKDVAALRLRDLREMLANRLAGLRRQINSLDVQRERLERGQRDQLERLKLGAEAIQVYARHILGVDL